jgi:hypothetical protein
LTALLLGAFNGLADIDDFVDALADSDVDGVGADVASTVERGGGGGGDGGEFEWNRARMQAFNGDGGAVDVNGGGGGGGALAAAAALRAADAAAAAVGGVHNLPRAPPPMEAGELTRSYVCICACCGFCFVRVEIAFCACLGCLPSASLPIEASELTRACVRIHVQFVRIMHVTHDFPRLSSPQRM